MARSALYGGARHTVSGSRIGGSNNGVPLRTRPATGIILRAGRARRADRWRQTPYNDVGLRNLDTGKPTVAAMVLDERHASLGGAHGQSASPANFIGLG
jgi:hypothetical protein